MSEWSELDFEARRAAHRRGHSKPLRNRAAIDRSYDAVAASTVGISATQFVSDGVLTDANIDDAIDAAIQEAMALTPAGLKGPGYIVTVPAGKWLLSRPHVIPCFGDYRVAVGFRGAGRHQTIFLVESDAEGSPVFTFGTYDATALPMGMGMYGQYGGFSVQAVEEGNCDRHGIVFYGPVQPLISDITVRGFCAPTLPADRGHGIRVEPVFVESVGFLNSQFVDMRDVDIFVCNINLWVRACYPMHLNNVSAQGGVVRNAVFDGVQGQWHQGGVQFGMKPSYFTYGECEVPSVVSGWSLTDGLPSGTGVTCSVAIDGLCTLTGLSGLDGTSNEESYYIEITPAGSSSNEQLVRGIYKIERVLSASSCTIRKGSNHAEQGSLSWQMRQSGQNYLSFDGLYDEGNYRPMFGFYASENGGGEYTLTQNQWSSSGPLVEARGVAKLTALNNRPARMWLTAVDRTDTDALFSSLELDAASYPGLRCLHNPFLIGGFTVSPPVAKDSGGGAQIRLRAALQELGAVEIWDARVASSLSLTGSDVDGWTGLINGTELTPSATEPTYDAADAELESACVVIGTGAGGASSALAATISADVLPDYGYGLSLVAVLRLPDTTNTADRCIVSKTGGAQYYQQTLALNDTVYAPNSVACVLGTDQFPGTGSVVPFAGLSADTAPRVFVAGSSGSSSTLLRTSWDGDVWSASGAITQRGAIPGDMQVSVGNFPGSTNSGAMRVVLLAIIPHALSHAEHQKIIDLARNEFPLVES